MSQNNYAPPQQPNNQNFNYPSPQESPKNEDFMDSQKFNKNQVQKRDSAMEEQSEFKTKNQLPSPQEAKHQDIDKIIGQYIKKEDLNYDATKYYIQSIIGKDNDYNPKWSQGQQ